MTTTTPTSKRAVDPRWLSKEQKDSIGTAQKAGKLARMTGGLRADSIGIASALELARLNRMLADEAEKNAVELTAIAEGTHPLLVKPSDPVDPGTDPIDPGTGIAGEISPEVGRQLGEFAWIAQLPAAFPDNTVPPVNFEPDILPIVVRVSDHVGKGRELAYALRAASDRLDKLDPSIRHQVTIIILCDGPAELQGLLFGRGSRSTPYAVPATIFDAESVVIAGPRPQRVLPRGMDENGPRHVNCAVRIHSGVNYYTDTIGIERGNGDDRTRSHAKLRLYGVEVECGGRAAIHSSPKTNFILETQRCRFTDTDTIGSNGLPLAQRWIIQAYDTSVAMLDSECDAPTIEEHLVYEHGHARGIPCVIRRNLSIGTGGQVLQFTERQYEVDDRGPDPIYVEDNVFTGFHKFAGKAGSAITFNGCGRVAEVHRNVVFDDDPTDTRGQQGTTVGTNYSALSFWTYGVDEESYAEETQRGYGNAGGNLDDNIFAIRSGNRKVAGFEDTEAVTVRRTSFMTAGSGLTQLGRVAVLVNKKGEQCGEFDYDGSEGPSDVVMQRFFAACGAAAAADYVELDISVERSLNGRSTIPHDGKAVVMGVRPAEYETAVPVGAKP